MGNEVNFSTADIQQKMNDRDAGSIHLLTDVWCSGSRFSTINHDFGWMLTWKDIKNNFAISFMFIQ